MVSAETEKWEKLSSYDDLAVKLNAYEYSAKIVEVRATEKGSELPVMTTL